MAESAEIYPNVDKQHLQIHGRIQNPAKHLIQSKKERSAKTILAWNWFPGTNMPWIMNMSEF